MRMRALGRTAAATALAGLAALLTTSGAGAAEDPLRNPAYKVPTQAAAVFNDPMSTDAGKRDAVRNELVDLIQRAEAGSEISGSVFLFNDEPAATALIRAAARGVKVRMIVDAKALDQKDSQVPRLREALGTSTAANSYLFSCPAGRGCIGTRAGLNSAPINHNKFFLFSKVAGAENVVYQSSANLTESQRNNLYNNAVVIPHAGLYSTYRKYHQELVGHGQGAGLKDYYKTRQDGPYETFFFPRQEKPGTPVTDASTDTVVSVLDNVRCLPDQGTKIRVAMFAFTREEVAKKLASLRDQGCHVFVFFNGYTKTDEGSSVSGDVITALDSGKVRKLSALEPCVADSPNQPGQGVGLHSKYLLIEGAYGDVDDTALVFTGSANYTVPTLRGHDDTLLKISDRTVYQQFENNFDDVLSGTGDKKGICGPPEAVPFQ
ncbi:phospholipase D-like domain-containing protein [Streptomyces erythrochromogenes]|uniref:phospholipase D-like domain-containing protein n=1 Tax=Streptomyces erythrochromogenes TaxID=285574 RepID=UPI0036CE3873